MSEIDHEGAGRGGLPALAVALACDGDLLVLADSLLHHRLDLRLSHRHDYAGHGNRVQAGDVVSNDLLFSGDTTADNSDQENIERDSHGGRESSTGKGRAPVLPY
jgi:hypothetical protein